MLSCTQVYIKSQTKLNLRYHSLNWVMHRREAFQFLLLDKGYADGSSDISTSDWQMLMDVINPDSVESTKFWATSLLVQSLSNWGVSVSKTLHTCCCQHHSAKKELETCNLKGRVGILLANGCWKGFLEDLKLVKMQPEAAILLQQLDDETSTSLITSFNSCKDQMILHGTQAWSFWDQMPHKLLSMAHHLILESKESEDEDRKKAARFLSEYDQCSAKSSLGMVAWHFFGHSAHRQDLMDWCDGKSLSPRLTQLFIGYGSSLVVMQRLEGRHHLLQQNISRGRALLPGGTMADLRRARHSDLHLPEFRRQLQSLMMNIGELGPDSDWTCRRDLLKRVYGYSLEKLHEDVTTETAILEKTSISLQQHQSQSDSRLVA